MTKPERSQSSDCFFRQRVAKEIRAGSRAFGNILGQCSLFLEWLGGLRFPSGLARHEQSKSNNTENQDRFDKSVDESGRRALQKSDDSGGCGRLRADNLKGRLNQRSRNTGLCGGRREESHREGIRCSDARRWRRCSMSERALDSAA